MLFSTFCKVKTMMVPLTTLSMHRNTYGKCYQILHWKEALFVLPLNARQMYVLCGTNWITVQIMGGTLIRNLSEQWQWGRTC